MRPSVRCIPVGLLALALLTPIAAMGQPQNTLQQLLQEVRRGREQDEELNRKREAEFQRLKTQQAQLLSRARASLTEEERRSSQLEVQFQEHERELAALEEQLRNRLGSLGELFGVVRQVAGDARADVENSLTSAQLPGREQPLERLAQSRKLPTIEQLEELWYSLQQEMTESGQVARFRVPVVRPDGEQEEREVVRIGVFSAFSDGKFLRYEGGKLRELPRQPGGRYQRVAASFGRASNGDLHEAVLDPSKGSILGLLVQAPTASERIQQGGIVGYVIIVLGVAGLLLAVYRFGVLTVAGRNMGAQAGQNRADRGNPLGRVLAVFEENPHADTETLELKLDEAVLREVPKLERGLTTIKVLSVIAPLLGLLGTVTGMIKTFQMITLFGTGDPKMMAAGISEALVTTMLGLTVAIPLTFLHSVVKERSKGLVEVLEEQSAGIVARHAEASEGASGA